MNPNFQEISAPWAITCDHLLERGPWTWAMDVLAELYETTSLYTLAHKEGKILGPLEMRSIHSSYLSRLLESESDLKKMSLIAPWAWKALGLPKDKKVLSFCRGLAPTLSFFQNNEVTLYLHDLELIRKSKKSGAKVSLFHENHLLEVVSQVEHLLVSSEELKRWLQERGIKRQIQVVRPPLPIHHFRPTSFGQKREKDFYCTDTSFLSLKTIKETAQTFERLKTKIVFFGHDNHIEELKKQSWQFVRFIGKRCTGDIAELLSEARAYLCLSNQTFCPYEVAALTMGTPLLILGDLPFAKEYAGEGNFLECSNLSDGVKVMDYESKVFDPLNLHKRSFAYHPTKFKNEIMRAMKGETSQVQNNILPTAKRDEGQHLSP